MALRLIELFASQEDIARLPELLEGRDPLGVWEMDLEGDLAGARILVDSSETEPVSDWLTRKLGRSEGFRIVLLRVEATIPPPPEPKPGNAETKTRPRKVGPARISREELFQDVSGSSKLTQLYLVTVVLSTVVAAVGLLRGDVAVIIGAMVIAPLLGPNVALALGSTLGDSDLVWRSLKTVAIGVALALALSVILGFFVEVSLENTQLASRAKVGLADIVLALAAGSAGALAYTAGLPGSLIGVMVAVALLPPTVAMGLFLGSGDVVSARGALLLVATNVTCVNLAGVVTFLAQRVRPRTWWKAKKAKKANRISVAIWLGMLIILSTIIYTGLLHP